MNDLAIRVVSVFRDVVQGLREAGGEARMLFIPQLFLHGDVNGLADADAGLLEGLKIDELALDIGERIRKGLDPEEPQRSPG